MTQKPNARPDHAAAALPPIHTVRGQRVMLDRDLAALYGVPTMVLNQAIKRNVARFPPDFIFRLTGEEFDNLKSQFVISSPGPATASGSLPVSSSKPSHGGTIAGNARRELESKSGTRVSTRESFKELADPAAKPLPKPKRKDT